MKWSRGKSVDAEFVRLVLDYDPLTGLFTWKKHRRTLIGKQAGFSDRSGHWRIRLRNKAFAAHRLAWLHVHGRFPDGNIDHINGNPADNRLANLREVSHVVNMQNQRRANIDSQTGLLGCHPHGTKFQAQITVNGRIKHLGIFASAHEGHEAYLAAKRKFHQGCTI
jgi:hypothetical protein